MRLAGEDDQDGASEAKPARDSAGIAARGPEGRGGGLGYRSRAARVSARVAADCRQTAGRARLRRHARFVTRGTLSQAAGLDTGVAADIGIWRAQSCALWPATLRCLEAISRRRSRCPAARDRDKDKATS